MMNRMRRDKVNETWLANFLATRREQQYFMEGDSVAAVLRARYEEEVKDLQKVS
jgi:hypothetical protein